MYYQLPSYIHPARNGLNRCAAAILAVVAIEVSVVVLVVRTEPEVEVMPLPVAFQLASPPVTVALPAPIPLSVLEPVDGNALPVSAGVVQFSVKKT